MDQNINYSELPDGIRQSLQSYIEDGEQPGPFLRAVLENDLRETLYSAQPEEMAVLLDIRKWMDGHCPAEAQGSHMQRLLWQYRRKHAEER